MKWKYALIEHEDQHDLLQIVELYDDDCYATLDANDWCFATKEDAIETLKLILKDLEGL